MTRSGWAPARSVIWPLSYENDYFAAMGSQSGLKLYAIAAVDNGSGDSLAPGTTLVHHRGLAAVVEPGAYSSPKLDEAEMERYATVVEEVFRAAPTLPAPPGTVFKSNGTLSHWLELHYFTLTDAMSVVEGQVAARVSIGSGATVKEDDATKSFKALGAEALRLFRGRASATVMLPLTEDESKNGAIARASFLVDADKWEAFQNAVSQESKRQPALDVVLTGPWPPYDFVRMQFGG